jgi:hypothetical protein
MIYQVAALRRAEADVRHISRWIAERSLSGHTRGRVTHRRLISQSLVRPPHGIMVDMFAHQKIEVLFAKNEEG